MIPKVKVAVVKAGDRATAVRQALALLSDDLKMCVRPGSTVLVKPNLVSHKAQLASTHAATFGATLNALFVAGAGRIIAAEGATDAPSGFTRFGLRREAEGRLVQFFDLNKDESNWEPLELTGLDGTVRIARVSKTVKDSECRVSLAQAKTHVTSMLTLSLKNMLSSIHPSDRVMMHGYAGGGNGYSGWRRLIVEFLKQDNVAVNTLTRTLGRLKNAGNSWKSWRNDGDPFLALTVAELGYLRSVEAMNSNLVALAKMTKPHIAVVDGFMAMHREGPRHGTPIRIGTVIAGTDAVAVDAVAAAVMGFDPRSIGYLRYAEEAGLGTINLDCINVIGEPIAKVRRQCVPHSNHHVQRHWPRISRNVSPSPHFSMTRARSESAVSR